MVISASDEFEIATGGITRGGTVSRAVFVWIYSRWQVVARRANDYENLTGGKGGADLGAPATSSD